MKMVLNKKQIQAVFLLEFKISRKAAETTHNINNTFGPGTAKERTVQWWFKKFRKGDESLEDDERSARPSEVDNDQLREIIDLYMYRYPLFFRLFPQVRRYRVLSRVACVVQ